MLRPFCSLSVAILLAGSAGPGLCQGVGSSKSAAANVAAWKTAIAKKEQAISKRFVRPPEGKRYEAMVPDTLDLAYRAELAINCLTGALDPERGYELYLGVHFANNPPFMHHEASGLPTNNPKFAESLAMMRVMSGSQQNLDIEHGMLLRSLALVYSDGLYYAPIIGRPWHQTWHHADDDFANIYGNSRWLLALMAWHQYDGNPMWMEYARKVVAGLRKIVRVDGQFAYFPDPMIGESFSYPKSGYPANLPEPTSYAFAIHMYHSGVMRALAKYSMMTGDRQALELAGKIANWVRQPKMWAPGPQPAGVIGAEKGHYRGHFHAHVASLRGLLEYAIAANDADLKEFVRNGYEYSRTFGIARIGWFPENATTGQHCESCCIADMVGLAAKLSDAGVGDYWEDVDRYTRNQLVEQQLVRKDCLVKLAAASPPHHATPPRETDDHVIERNIGGFVGHGDLRTLPNTWIMHCCTGNGTQALYYAWEGIIRADGKGTSQINLLLNRASPWADIDSYLPYEGKVVITNKTSKTMFVRIPNWVSRANVRCRVGTRPVQASWVANYLDFENLRPTDVIEIAFPMVQWTSTDSLEGETYTLHFRGNTLIDFTSRPADGGPGIRDGRQLLPDGGSDVVGGVHKRSMDYPIYQRKKMRANKAPMVRKTRFVLDRHIAS